MSWCPAVFQVCNYQGQARVVVQLVTALTSIPQLHAHSLVGKQCDKGICIADLQSKDSTIRSASPSSRLCDAVERPRLTQTSLLFLVAFQTWASST